LPAEKGDRWAPGWSGCREAACRSRLTGKQAPEEAVRGALEYLRFLAARVRADKHPTAIASETVLARDWTTAEEETAWESL
jgi:hypothetical protein